MDLMDIRNFQYKMYLAEAMLDDIVVERYVNECMCLSEGNYEKFQVISEGFSDKVKEGLLKLKNTIIRLWNKFVESSRNLITRDKTYLEKYKDIILKKKLRDVKFEMYNYPEGIKLLINSKMPPFDYNKLKNDLNSKGEFNLLFLKSIGLNLPKEILTNDDNVDTYGGCVLLFRGGDEQIEINSNTLNMTDLYNYCYNYKDMVALIQKDIKFVEESYNKFVTLIDKAARKEKINQKKEEEEKQQEEKLKKEQEANSKDSGSKNVSIDGEEKANSLDIHENSATYSIVKGTYLNEVKINSTGDSGVKSKGNDAANPNKYRKMSNKNDDGTTVKNSIDDFDKEDTSDELLKKAKVYYSVVSDFLAAKKFVSEECYKEYMTIIKYHIRYFLKTENNPGK